MIGVGVALAGCAADERPAVPPAQPLGARLAEHPRPFTGPIRMAELSDGRVLAHDARETRLVMVDFAGGTEAPVASRGAGPLEYQSAHRIVRAGGDSLWLFDVMQGRILVFSPDGRPVRSFPTSDRNESAARVSAPWLEGVSPNGDWYGRARGFFARREGTQVSSGFADSVAVVRVGAQGGQDTVAMLRAQSARRASSLGGRQVLSHFDPIDLFGVLSDGAVLVVRGETYTPELLGRDGSVRRAQPVVHQRVALREAEVRQMVDSMQRMTLASMAGVLAQTPQRAGGVPLSMEMVAPDPRPATWPVFSVSAILVDRQDRAWVGVRDSAMVTRGQRYDLLDREGRWVAAVRLPLRHELVGFGEGVVYVARRDADDLLWLGRHALP